MDTQFLTTFVMVVDRGSMAAAARLLNITPAAVAQQIRTLERELGAPLIARAGRTVTGTEAGMRILGRARELLRDA
ncbi:MAG: LysR family transcriptional regulator, partial [Burkholderiaceae bacterium]